MKSYRCLSKKLITLCLCIIIIGSVSGGLPVMAQESKHVPKEQVLTLYDADPIMDPSEYDNNEILIAFQNEQAREKNQDFLEQLAGITILDTFYEYALLSAETEEILDDTLDTLARNQEVVYVQPNYRMVLESSGTLEPDFNKQWGLDNQGSFGDQETSQYDIDINAPEAWEVFPEGGRDIVVAVIDTGIDIVHEDLKDMIWTNQEESENGKDSDGNGYVDDIYGWNFFDNTNEIYQRRYQDYKTEKGTEREYEDDHGTHIAGIIAAAHNGKGIAGIAGNINIKIMPLKVAGIINKKTGYIGAESANMLKAIKYAKENGAKICNISMGFNNNDVLLQTVIKNSGIVIVAAAGNGTSSTNGIGFDIDNQPNYPASFSGSNIISVANVNYNGELDKSSCYGKVSVDVGAPGTKIYSTLAGKEAGTDSILGKYGGEDRYGYMTGTSMAAPMVSGALAVIYSFYPDITIMQAKNILLGTVREMPSLKGKTATGGMIDLCRALTDESVAELADTTLPVIKAEVKEIAGSYKKTLNLQVTDPGNNLIDVYYAKGKKTEDYFSAEGKGTKIAVTDQVAQKKITVSDTGTYTIYAMDKAGNWSLTTKKVNIKTVSLNAQSKTIKVGASFTLKGKIAPSSYTGTITYTSSNSKIASVNKKSGKITAKKKGKVVITAAVRNGKAAKCTIIIK